MPFQDAHGGLAECRRADIRRRTEARRSTLKLNRSFYEVVEELTEEYQRVVEQHSETLAENARLRHHMERALEMSRRSRPPAKKEGAAPPGNGAVEAPAPGRPGSRPSSRQGSKRNVRASRTVGVETDSTVWPTWPSQEPEADAAPGGGARKRGCVPLPEPKTPPSPRSPPDFSPREPRSTDGSGDGFDTEVILATTLDVVCPRVDEAGVAPAMRLRPSTRSTRSESPAADSKRSSLEALRLGQGGAMGSSGTSLALEARGGAGSHWGGSEKRGNSARIMSDTDLSAERNIENGAELEVLPLWTTAYTKKNRIRRKKSSESALSKAEIDKIHLEEQDRKKWTPGLTMRPSGAPALTWDCLTLVVLMYDLVMIPLQGFADVLPDSEAWEMCELVATITWTIDLFLSFIRGYEVHGDVEMRLKETVKHYLRSWFVFDVSIVGLDWMLFFAKTLDGDDLVDWLRFSRFRRALRLLRLTRLVKHGTRAMQALNKFQSEDWLVFFRISCLLILLIAINHFIACGWYWIGTMDMYADTWTRRFFQEGFEAHGLSYRYATAFHWSVTQFTPASMEVYPLNAAERAYNILIILIGLLMFSSFVSSMTNSMTYLTQRNYQKRTQRDTMLHYMNVRGLSMKLKNDICNYISHAKKTRKIVVESDVPDLQRLPEMLLERLHVELFKENLEQHPVFVHIYETDATTLINVCHHAVSERSLIIGEELFRFGVRCNRMYFPLSGLMTYTFGFSEDKPLEVWCGSWLCEASLWTKWDHRGRLVANTASELCELDAVEFQIIASHSLSFPALQRYAHLYIATAVRDCGGAEHIADLWGQRLRVKAIAVQAFTEPGMEEGSDSNPAENIIQILCGKGIDSERCFQAWVGFVQRVKAERQPGWRGLRARLRSLLDWRLQSG